MVGMGTEMSEEFAGGHGCIRFGCFENSAIAIGAADGDVIDAAEECRKAGAGETIEHLQAVLPAIDPARLAHQREVLRYGRKIASDESTCNSLTLLSPSASACAISKRAGCASALMTRT